MVDPEGITSELDDYRAPIVSQDLEVPLDLFRRKFRTKLASIHQDTLLFQFGSHANSCVIPIHAQAGFKGVAPGEPICIFNLRRVAPAT